jgi:hypothetical protein
VASAAAGWWARSMGELVWMSQSMSSAASAWARTHRGAQVSIVLLTFRVAGFCEAAPLIAGPADDG